MRQIVFDTETTGLDPRDHRIVEIGCVELVNRRVVNEQRWYLNPDRDSDPDALGVHGLTTAFLADKPHFADIAEDFIRLLSGAEVIIHNAAFDTGFVDAELARAGRAERIAGFASGVTDTWQLAKKLHPGKKAGLDALCERYHVDNSHRNLHGALLDARLLADVYLAMTGGQAALGLASRAAGGSDAASGIWTHLLTGADRPLRVIRASEAELAAHAERIAYIAKKSGRVTWPEQAVSPPATADVRPA